MKNFARTCLLVLLLALILGSSAVLAGDADKTKKILILNTHQTYTPWEELVSQSFRAQIASSNSGPYQISEEYLDLAAFSDKNENALVRDLLRTKYANQSLDLVIAVNDGASFLLTHYGNELFPGAPLLISGGGQEIYKHPPKNLRMTSVYFEEDILGSLNLALKLLPKTKNVFVVTGSSPFDHTYQDKVRKQLGGLDSSIKVSYLTDMTINDLLKRVAHLPPDSLIYYVMMVRDSSGKIFVPRKVCKMISSAANAPVIGLYDTFMDYGILGGKLASAEMNGITIAQVALRILSGENPSEIPPSQAPDVNVFDWRQMKRWGLLNLPLPKGSIIKFREYSLWELYWGWILAAAGLLALQAMLIALLLVQRRIRAANDVERKRAEKELRRTNRALHTLSRCSQVLVRARDEEEVLQSFCRIIAEGGYRMAWIGLAEQDEAKSVRPVAQMGFDEGYLDTAEINWAETSRGRGPTGRAIRTGHTVVARDLLSNPNYTPWRDQAIKRGYASSISLPMKIDAQVLGALTIYASQPDAFNDVEVELLEKVAQSLAYGIVALRSEEARRHAEEEMQKSEEQFRTAFENAPEGMALVDLKRRFLEVNPRLCEMLGYTKEELLGKSFNQFTHPDDQQAGRDRWGKFVAGDLSVKRAEKRYIHKNGQVVWAVVSNSAISNSQGDVKYILAHIYDITDRKRAEEELRQANESLLLSEKDLRESQRIAHVGSWRLDIVSNEVVWSEELYKMYGFDPALPPPPYTEHQKLFTPESWGRLSAALSQTVETGIPYELELETVRDNGSRGWMWVRGETVLDARGEIVGLCGAAQDITDRKLIEQERVLLESQLRQALKMEAMGTLAGGIAHDFNNILAAIMGYSELALGNTHTESENQDYLAQILAATARAKKLVQQILIFSRKSEVKMKPIDLNHQVTQAVELIKQTIPRMVNIELLLAEGLRPITGDSGQIEQIVMNLGVNASDAMPEGGDLVIETENVSLDGEYCQEHLEVEPGDYVRLQISDTGHGMTKEVAQHIFDPFFTTKEVGKGTGLGLATVYGIVRGHGGFINCYSEPGQGTAFNIYFPALQAEDTPKTSGLKATVEAPGGSETILLVDDEEPLRDLGRLILSREGYEVITAGSGEEALEIFRQKEGGFDLVILDLNMPGIGGHKCFREMLKLDPQTKALVASGYSFNSQLRDTLATGAAGYLAKPYQRVKMLRKIREVLDKK